MFDVAIVGAGPAGLHTACRLTSYGLDVVLLDGQVRVGERAICSGVIGEEAFARFDLPTRSVLATIHCIQAISPEGRTLEHRTAAPLARVVEKGAFNRELASRAASAGVQIWCGRPVESIEREKRSVALRFRCPGERTETLKARFAVIASGANYSLNTILGLAKPREFLRAIQADVYLGGTHALYPTQVFVGRSVAPGAFGWNIPLGNGRARVGLVSVLDPRPYFDALLSKIAPGFDMGPVKVSQKSIGQAPVGRCVADNVIAIGEAAGHVKTTTGGGIHYGLLSAEFAADVILRAFRDGSFTARRLEDFERYWRKAFGHELLTGYFARKLAAGLSDSLIEKIFADVKATNLLVRLNGSLKFDWHHRALLTTVRSLLTPSGTLRIP